MVVKAHLFKVWMFVCGKGGDGRGESGDDVHDDGGGTLEFRHYVGNF